ncbi:DUF924 family protein [Alteromonas sp. 1_MG-2023]|uniref:DUF924 family protein n=1 Tax=Alteromonas sp. 1_MG-2023 TaxID=3062669 RepID=UPI0026E15A22|nr:DUF924 family protein [Alteromonas sp. 1_MG-2023]MDO6477361.1 DUF924 family protein [Alteromonas sp. 1_MG-2023]
MKNNQWNFKAVLDFWFFELSPQDWFMGSESLDEDIRTRFSDLLKTAANGECHSWISEARGRLALIILLDQFPRHIHRNTEAAYATDLKALKLTLEGIVQGVDSHLSLAEKHFFYMPLMHAENRELQLKIAEEAALIKSIATSHASIVQRFGRFPHRNKINHRTTTELEEHFLKSEENRFV